ncbi:MAG TPA: 2-phospho-L-lactate transferase [Dehalococcoidia bacterium]|jgi:LPPG:FO 2-phospho-L-lactate transferase|nr:2-phospho-L-lactate transferase [Chloroflexota bacterium]MDP7161199.1 2-phospho-L-lactate transferase [Dehalococcoidia bacterium]MDP7213557.1 2-phospho-L-lactate transferase [Dehalococcoidia bacterium]HJM52848.1 2-phospho-L-lactate transferase [Dehalococcoidia bacterium]
MPEANSSDNRRGGVLALAGGVGGAKLAVGLARVLPPDALTVVVNTGDDEIFYGLHVSPDIDTVTYSLAGLANPETGWGFAGDTFNALGTLKNLGADTWFGLGDHDLALHLRRTDMLRSGKTLSDVTLDLSRRMGVRHPVVPMSDQPVRTIIESDDGEMSFQEYFVHRRSEPEVIGLRFDGADSASPSPVFKSALESPNAIVFCPSNPFLSVDPIMALPGVREMIAVSDIPRVAVSPIIGGRAVKGPAARIFQTFAQKPPSALAVAEHYEGIATHFVMDNKDESSRVAVEALGYEVLVTETLMTTDAHKIALAIEVCGMAGVPI